MRAAAALLLGSLVVSVPPLSAQPTPLETKDAAVERMVEHDLRGRGIRDGRVLDALRRVPRERFVPPELAARAYEDGPLPIGHGQTISQPYVVAWMTESLQLRGDERVLEIGTGSGYQAAVLAELGVQVYSIEIVEALAARARALFHRLPYANLQLRTGDGYQGWPDAAPFDAILLTAAPPRIPQPLLDQLAVGGRMVLPLGEQGPQGQAMLRIVRTAQGFEEQRLGSVRFVPMTGEAQRRD